MTIRLNGEPREVAGPVSISALLAALDIDPRRVAVEHNLVVVRRDAYASTMVSDGDEVEIVNFVGGGSTQLPRSCESQLGIEKHPFRQARCRSSRPGAR